jgi:hypothetical protein
MADLEARLAAAKQLLAEARFEPAAAALEGLLTERPDFLQARYELAVAHYHLGRLDEAIDGFVAVAAVNVAGLRSDEFYHALQALPDPKQALAALEPLLPKLSHTLKQVEGYGRLLRKAAAAAGLPHGDIEVIGDSHSVASFASNPRCRVHWLGARTMYRITREPIDLGALGVAPGARIVTVFGEIDCRAHVIAKARETGTTPSAMVTSLANAYVRSLQQTVERGGGAQLAITAVLPPARTLPDDPELGAVGAPDERRDIALSLNRALADAAQQAGFGFLDVATPYADADGFLNPAASDGSVHLDFRFTAPIAAGLDAMFGPAPPAS